MAKILIPNFTLSPEHFAYDGIKTHCFELIDALISAKHDVSMIVNVNKKAPNFMSPVNHFLLNSSKPWYSPRPEKRFNLKLKLFNKVRSFDGSDLQDTFFKDLAHIHTIYMAHQLKRRASSKFIFKKKLLDISYKSFYREYDMLIQSYPFPIYKKNMPNILIVHDVIPLDYPHLVGSTPKRFFTLLETLINKYDKILTVSEYAKKALLNYFKVDEKKIDVVYQTVGNPAQCTSLDKKGYLEMFGLKSKQFLLYVARIEPRKNHHRLIEAYSLAKTDLPLVLVGRLDSDRLLLPDTIKNIVCKNPNANSVKLNKNKKIIWINSVSHHEITILYQTARALIYPSEAEGFGLPLVEAFNNGCPVAASNATAIPEVTGNAALLFNPYHINEIANAMTQLSLDDTLCATLADEGNKRLAFFSKDLYKERLNTSLSAYF